MVLREARGDPPGLLTILLQSRVWATARMVWRTAWCLRPADVHNRRPLSQLFHEQERRVYDDSAYARQKVLIHSKAPTARDFTN